MSATHVWDHYVASSGKTQSYYTLQISNHYTIMHNMGVQSFQVTFSDLC